jgi:hypothetical protein
LSRQSLERCRLLCRVIYKSRRTATLAIRTQLRSVAPWERAPHCSLARPCEWRCMLKHCKMMLYQDNMAGLPMHVLAMNFWYQKCAWGTAKKRLFQWNIFVKNLLFKFKLLLSKAPSSRPHCSSTFFRSVPNHQKDTRSCSLQRPDTAATARQIDDRNTGLWCTGIFWQIWPFSETYPSSDPSRKLIRCLTPQFGATTIGAEVVQVGAVYPWRRTACLGSQKIWRGKFGAVLPGAEAVVTEFQRT